MPHHFRRAVLAVTASAGALLTALTSAATASADEWTVGPVSPGQGGLLPPQVVSESGTPPFDQSLLQSGGFIVEDHTGTFVGENFVDGQLSSTDYFGVVNEDLVVISAGDTNVPLHSVIDILNFGGGYENQYVDLVGLGANGTNEITDTFITPFGDFNIPSTFDASALDFAYPAAVSGFTSALEADWASLVALF